jgi:copper chaperone NosL
MRSRKQDSKSNITLLLAWAVLMMIALNGCDGDDVIQPPVVYWGQSECEVCRMIVSDDRYAAGVVVVRANGRLDGFVFDDLGCLLQWEQEANAEQTLGNTDSGSSPPSDANTSTRIAARYVRDLDGSGWLDANTAAYVHSESLKTPMAFHVAALPDGQRAQTVARDHAGDVLNLQAVRDRFERGVLREFSKSDNGS